MSSREKRAAKREEKRRMLDDAIRFERESKLGDFSSAGTPDPEYTEYRDAEMREYPDPEHRSKQAADCADYGIEVSRVHTDRKENADLPSAGGFNRRALRQFIRRATALDRKRIAESYEYKLRELKLELRGAEMSFTEKSGRGARTEREIKADIAQVRAERRREMRRARVLGKVCLSVLLTNFSTCKIKRRADRAALVELRSELLSLVTEKYHLDERLISIYTGADRSESFSGRFSAEMKGKRRAHKLQRRIRREIEENHVSPAYTKKIYALMDEYVTVSGELERISFSLKRERPRGTLKRELKRRRKLRRRLSRLADNIEYYKKRGIDRAEDKRATRKNIILGWTALGLIIALGVLIFVFWGDITAYIASLTGGGA